MNIMLELVLQVISWDLEGVSLPRNKLEGEGGKLLPLPYNGKGVHVNGINDCGRSKGELFKNKTTAVVSTKTINKLKLFVLE